MTGTVCDGIVGCLWAFQTLIAGGLATLGALATAGIIYRSAHLPIKAEKTRLLESTQRRVRLRCLELSEEFKLLGKRARQGQGTVKVVKAANSEINDQTRQKMLLIIPSATQDWEFMSLIPEETARECLRLNGMVQDHNFDMERAGGAFGDDNFGRIITDRLEAIARASVELSESVLGIRFPLKYRSVARTRD